MDSKDVECESYRKRSFSEVCLLSLCYFGACSQIIILRANSLKAKQYMERGSLFILNEVEGQPLYINEAYFGRD